MIIASVILNWQNAESTIKCAESLIEAYDLCFSDEILAKGCIVIVDNGSSETVTNKLKNWHKLINNTLVQLVFNKSNLGFSGGMNKGICKSFDIINSDYVWLLNNDITCTKGSLLNLIKHTKNNQNTSIIGSTVIDEDTNLLQCAGGSQYNKWLGIDFPIEKGTNIKHLNNINVDNVDKKLDYIYGAAMFVKADILKKLNGLDEAYFLYFEELDLIHRLIDLSGGRPQDYLSWCPHSLVYHKGGASIIDNETEYLTTYHASLSAFIFTKRFCEYQLISVMVSRLVGKLLHSMVRRKWYLIKAVIDSIKSFMSESEIK